MVFIDLFIIVVSINLRKVVYDKDMYMYIINKDM